MAADGAGRQMWRDGSTVAAGATRGGGAATSRSALRRAQRRAALAALRSRLTLFAAAAAEPPVAAPGTIVEDVASFAEELAHRLVLLAPRLAAGLPGAALAPVVRRRRNVAAHSFGMPAAEIASVGSSALNRIQRGHPRPDFFVETSEVAGASLE